MASLLSRSERETFSLDTWCARGFRDGITLLVHSVRDAAQRVLVAACAGRGATDDIAPGLCVQEVVRAGAKGARGRA